MAAATHRMAGGVPPDGDNVTWRYEVVSWGSASAAGPRHDNGDRVGADGYLFSVADGVGSLALGGLAAAAAVRSLHRFAPNDGAGLEEAFFTANNAVRALQRSADLQGGSTLTALLVGSAGCFLAHVGDSRAFMLRPGHQLELLTVDDNLATHRGVGPEDADYRGLASRLTRCMGTEPVLEVSAQALPVYPELVRVALTTDGVHDRLSEASMSILAEEPDPSRAATQLVHAAAGAGAVDDCSVLVVDLAPQAHASREIRDGDHAAR